MECQAIKVPRDSSIELLRIIGMLFVVLHHANFPSLGVPTQVEFLKSPIWIIGESMTLVCVNIFVLISGWYGIKYKGRGVANLVFSALFYLYIIALALVLYDVLSVDEMGVNWSCHKLWFLPIMGGTNWYILQYLILYMCSPMLNQFCESSSRKELGAFILFMLFINVYVGYVWHNGPFSNGYNFILMGTLYLVARYMNMYLKSLITHYSPFIFFMLYFVMSIMYASFMIVWYVYTAHEWPDLYAYNNPFIILSSVCLFCAFLKMKFNSPTINRISKTMLAVLLVHMHPILQQYFYSFVVGVGVNPPLCFLLYLVLFVCFIFTTSFLLDQLRQFLFGKLVVIMKI